MKIVITEGFTVSREDLGWESLSGIGELTVFERMTPDEIVEHCKDADIILSNKLSFDLSTLAALPKLKLICVMATGYNVIDIKAARERNITVCNVPGYGTDSVAQHTFALILELTNHAGLHAKSVADGEWVAATDWCYTKKPLMELAGKTLGIVGYGNIGKKVAQIGSAFGMNIICNTPHPPATSAIKFIDLPALFEESDFISLHCPLKANNFQFVNQSLLHLMKPSGYIINTARGQLIHEQDLADALNRGQIAGAALDVLSTEPPSKDNPLFTAKNCIITPHIAWISREARQRIIDITAKNIRAFLDHRPVNVVN